jgi:hypothetical protein
MTPPLTPPLEGEGQGEGLIEWRKDNIYFIHYEYLT